MASIGLPITEVNSSVYEIPLLNLSLMLFPVIIVIAIYAKWALHYQTILYAALRMLLQLITIGFLLIYIFG